MNPGTLNTQNDAPLANPLGRPRFRGEPTPSLRVPVTSGNRELLRRLRADEMLAWRAADVKSRRPFRIRLEQFATEPFFRLNVNHV
jgi:hypothetical protein